MLNRRRRAVRVVAAALLLSSLVSLLSCGPRLAPRGGPGPSTTRDAAPVAARPVLTLRLSDVDQPGARPASIARPPAAPLPAAAIEALLARVPPLPAPAIAASPGLTGRRSLGARPRAAAVAPRFPAAAIGPPPPPGGAPQPLTVERWGPDGTVARPSGPYVTFSQPMVAVTTADADATAATTPVSLTPQPPGRWRWLGAQTAAFEAPAGLPHATTYQVEVPAGTRSASGAVLAEPTRFRFTTPTPRVEASWPADGPQARDVPIFVRFDQRIDPPAVLATIAIRAGGAPYRARLLTDDEVARHDALAALVADARAADQDGRWLAFTATESLPPAARIEVAIGPGTPSAEGPDRTTDVQRFAFVTAEPLRIVRATCGQTTCDPGEPLEVEFNNPLATDAVDARHLVTTPAVTNAEVLVSDRVVWFGGATGPATTYRTVVAGEIRDQFGQRLGRDQVLTWTTAPAPPRLLGPGPMVVLDPSARSPTLTVLSTGHAALRVEVLRATPADYADFVRYRRDRAVGRTSRPPGTRVLDEVRPVPGSGSAPTETQLDLTAALPGGLGHAIVVVEPAQPTPTQSPAAIVTWVQATRLAVDATVDADALHAWVTELADGAPIAGAAVTIEPGGHAATTRPDGTARLPLTAPARAVAARLVARRGDDVAFVPAGDVDVEHTPWRVPPRADELHWYVTDDRHRYRPGEDVHLKGWLRRWEMRTGGDLAGVGGQVTSVAYRVLDGDEEVLAEGQVPVGALGGFDLRFTLPRSMRLGYTVIELEARGAITEKTWHALEVEDLRRPDHEVEVHADDAIVTIGGAAELTASARAFTGGGLSDAPVTWEVTARPAWFSPPDRDDYSFGRTWTWSDRAARDDGDAPASWTHRGRTNADGLHVLRLEPRAVAPSVAMTLEATAEVTDVNRQAWRATTQLLVHPADVYVGLRTPRPVVAPGQVVEVDAIAVDLDGRAVDGRPIVITATDERDDAPQTCAVTSAVPSQRCRFVAPAVGALHLVGVVTDAAGRTSASELTVEVAGAIAPTDDLAEPAVALVADAATYRPGDTATIAIEAPFAPAEGILTVRRSGIVSSTRFTMAGRRHTATVPITDDLTPGVHVHVELVGQTAGRDARGAPDPAQPRRPASAVGELALAVPPRHRALGVTIAPSAATLAPGATTALTVTVVDAAGAPVRGAEVAVIVVDEAVLALSGSGFDHPLDSFYPPRASGVHDHRLRSYLPPAPDAYQDAEDAWDPLRFGRGFRAVLGTAAGASSAPVFGAPAVAAPIGPPALRLRRDLDPLAAFIPAVTTDAAGVARVEVTLPDNLTRYRVVALAAAGERQFGKGEDTLTARLPLMVRPSPPRFLHVGDQVELPVVVHNPSDAAREVDVAVRATGATLTASAGQRVVVPAHDRVEVRFAATAPQVGTARFQVVAVAGGDGDAAEVALPVRMATTIEDVATHGHLDRGALRQPIALPADVDLAVGGLTIELSTTQRPALTDGWNALTAYPYDCSEQLASRLLGFAAVRDRSTGATPPDLPSRAALDAQATADLERLYQRQHRDGGFSLWRADAAPWPFVAVHVVHALVRAKAQGLAVDDARLADGLTYLRELDGRLPPDHGAVARAVVTAYALYTRALAGDRDVARAQRMIAEAGGVAGLPLEATGWLLGVLAGDPAAATERAALVRHLENQVHETAATAGFTTTPTVDDHLILRSDGRADAVVLEALLAEAPGHGLVPKLVAGLRDQGPRHRRGASTQVDGLALHAVAAYLRRHEPVAPAVVAAVWLGDRATGDLHLGAPPTDRVEVTVPMATVAALTGAGTAEVVLHKDGPGRLYYRLGLTAAPARATRAAADHGFAVSRRYQAVDEPDDVVRNPDGSWRIKAGARVRVALTLSAPHRRHHVALADPLPAGLEPLHLTPPVAGAGAAATPGWPPWAEHQQLRDHRAEAFASDLAAGVHELHYLARATTPGRFIAPPPKAEEMYHPETFGHAASDVVVVE